MRHNQNRRSRGRNNNRKGPNPLTRSFESNGPDVKVRGTAAHIAEKYLTLARDAQSAGDIVAVESYLQHAEHYNRIVMAAQAQFQQSQPQFRDGPDDGYDDDGQMNGRTRDRLDYNGDGRSGEDGEERAERPENEGDDRGYRPRPPRMEEQDRPRGDDRQRAGPRDDQDRQRGPRDEQDRQRGPRDDRYQFRDRNDRNERSERDDRGEQSPRNNDNRGPQIQPQAAAPASAVPFEDPAIPPRRRRGRPRADSVAGENGATAEDSDSTPDGAAALAAFRSES